MLFASKTETTQKKLKISSKLFMNARWLWFYIISDCVPATSVPVWCLCDACVMSVCLMKVSETACTYCVNVCECMWMSVYAWMSVCGMPVIDKFFVKIYMCVSVWLKEFHRMFWYMYHVKLSKMCETVCPGTHLDSWSLFPINQFFQDVVFTNPPKTQSVSSFVGAYRVRMFVCL